MYGWRARNRGPFCPPCGLKLAGGERACPDCGAGLADAGPPDSIASEFYRWRPEQVRETPGVSLLRAVWGLLRSPYVWAAAVIVAFFFVRLPGSWGLAAGVAAFLGVVAIGWWSIDRSGKQGWMSGSRIAQGAALFWAAAFSLDGRAKRPRRNRRGR